eukprot:3086736-Alexandrium_andersonii.AAC.1
MGPRRGRGGAAGRWVAARPANCLRLPLAELASQPAELRTWMITRCSRSEAQTHTPLSHITL